MSQHPASFRDDSGFVFTRGGELFRQVNQVGLSDYQLLMESGLYKSLVSKGWLVSHEEVSDSPLDPETAALVIKPQRLSFISYPYEWCFEQLRDAALLTLSIQQEALNHGMVLKDASAFNIQFQGGQPIFMDTLSFEKYTEGEPWVAYKQFCEHFLAPLALMHFGDPRVFGLWRQCLEGFPLDLTSRLLPFRSRLSMGIGIHIHAHAKAIGKDSGANSRQVKSLKVTKQAVLGLIANLTSTINGFQPKSIDVTWDDYKPLESYSSTGFNSKKDVVAAFLAEANPTVVWDIGANTGEFPTLEAQYAKEVIAWDIDHDAVQTHYRLRKSQANTKVLPLICDWANPTPSLGWAAKERSSVFERSNADCIVALAVIHHLAIGRFIPFTEIAESFAKCAAKAIVEFVPASDKQAQTLVAGRDERFSRYTDEEFRTAFEQFFTVVKRVELDESERVMYLLSRL